MNILDRALHDIRNKVIPKDEVEQAASRVMGRLQAEQEKVVPLPARIRGCEDFQALIPAYRSNSLVPARRLLLEDHLHECVLCRKASQTLTTPHRFARTPPHEEGSLWQTVPLLMRRGASEAMRGGQGLRRAGIAAAAAVFIAVLLAQTNPVRNFIWPIDVHAMARTVDGNLYSLTGQDVKPIAAGQRIEREQAVRTGAGSQAVLELADGTRVEMSERTELQLNRARDGVRIELARGNVIVAAAHQHGHLYVTTSDSTTTVVGTVFAVTAGTKGSRVSVIEGRVQVEHEGTSETITPGQQVITSRGLARVPVEQEIAWSRDQERYQALLKDFVAAGQVFAQQVGSADMRYASKLVPLIPEDTAVVASLPNLGQSLAQSYAVFKQRIAENGVLNDWWRESPAAGNGRVIVDEMVDWAVRAAGDLGPEIIIAASKNNSPALLLGEAVSPSDLAAVIEDGVRRLRDLNGKDPGVRVVRNATELAAAASSGASLVVYVDQGVMVISTSASQIQRTIGFIAQPSANRFTSTRLYARLAQAYREGVGWMLAADLQQFAATADAVTAAEFQHTGLLNAQELVIEQKTGSTPAFLATLGFNQDRKGMASWLSAPSTMGALEFVSANAYAVAGVVTKDPLLILDDVFSMIQLQSDAWQHVQEYQQQNHIDLRYDFAGTLGNEFLFALDGPLLPTPSWKVIIEVNDASRLQNAIQSSVNEANRQAAVNQKPGINLRTESSGGLTFYSITSSEFPTEIHYTFWMGYLIVAPSRPLLTDAMQYRNTATSLARSERFRSELPFDGRAEISGVVYQNVKAIADALPGGAVPQSVGDVLPTLICLYGYPDRILMSSKGVLGGNIASAGGLNGLMNMIHH